jgi:predicted GNAT family N-acyltransferase
VISGLEVVEIVAADTHDLRRSVLRWNTPTKEVVFAEDEWPGCWHLGLRREGVMVAVCSWVPRPLDDRPAVQLRGMATDRALQGTGLGGELLEEGCRVALERGFDLVWARARDSALAFYDRHGFVVEGNGFIDEGTQMPHHLISRALR